MIEALEQHKTQTFITKITFNHSKKLSQKYTINFNMLIKAYKTIKTKRMQN